MLQENTQTQLPDACLPKDKFMELLDEEMENYVCDVIAELGMIFNRLIIERRRIGVSEAIITNDILRFCDDLMASSPESALESKVKINKFLGYK